MTEEEIIRFASGLPGVVVVTASEAGGVPEVAWGDSFFFYDPDGTGDRRIPFTTIVTKDYDGFDMLSKLDRPGVFRLNVAVGRERFEELLGYSPAEHVACSASVDYAALDEVIPHPVYAAQAWVSILCPGPNTSEAARALITHAQQRAMVRHRPTTG